MSSSIRILGTFLVAILIGIAALPAAAQSTEFTFQGNLQNGGGAASGNHDFEILLYDAVSGGTQLGSTLTRNAVPVSSGVFSIKLDFGAQFTGGPRFIEVRVRQSGAPGFTPLLPRQPVSSSPYSIYSFNATNAASLNGVPATGFIQNGTGQQINTSFNIGQTGSANIFNATTQYNIDGVRLLSAPGSANTFVGRGAGASNTESGSFNSFFGFSAGQANTNGYENSFFGTLAGQLNSIGFRNSFFGSSAGISNTTGAENSFYGRMTGTSNTTGSNNAFFGAGAGDKNTSGNFNSFFGHSAGANNLTANNNAFFGNGAGFANTTGTDNAFFGAGAGGANTTANNNSFFGRSAGAATTTGLDNSFFGWRAGTLNTTGFANSFFGRSAGQSNSTGVQNSFFGQAAGASTTIGNNNSFFGTGAGGLNTSGGANTFVGINAGQINSTGSNNVFVGADSGNSNLTGSNLTIIGTTANVLSNNLSFATAIGAGATVSTNNTIVLGRSNGSETVFVPGVIQVNNLGLAGATTLCRNASNQISGCSSSLRYKSNVQNFSAGLDLIRKLRPVSFNWKNGGMLDVGLVAEEVNAAEPLLTTTNDKGQVEGVKYDRVGVVLVNAVNEQQAEIERQRDELIKLRAEVALLTKFICTQNPEAEICGPRK